MGGKKLKLIGNGVQYFVYDLENGSVLKKKTSFIQKISIYRKWWPDMKWTTCISYALNSTKDTKRARKFVLNNSVVSSLLGCPHYPNKYFRRYNFIQKKLVPLDVYIRDSQLASNKEILKKYVDLVKKTWAYGFSDKIFNFDRNCGVDETENVILFDFCEITFLKEEVRELIENQYWLRKESYRDLSEELQLYFKELMSQELTIDNLEKVWTTSLS